MRYRHNIPKSDVGLYIRIGLIVGAAIMLFSVISEQTITFMLNTLEFDIFFIKPVYYAIISGIILSSIAFVRVNIKKRESIFFWLLSLIVSLLKGEPIRSEKLKYKEYKISIPNFIIWQITKMLVFSAFFSNITFGMAINYYLHGNDLGISYLPNIFSLPFIITPGSQPNPSISKELVVPMLPVLTLIIPPLLAAIGTRILLYVGISNLIHTITSYIVDLNEDKPKYFYYISIIESIIGVALLWLAFNYFFPSMIDYNTPYLIIGTLLIGLVILAWSFIDMRRSRVIILPTKRDIYLKVVIVGGIAITTFIITTINNSIADARKIEYLGPYTIQQITINRYFADLDKIKEVTYNIQLNPIPLNKIDQFINENSELLSKIRLWDSTAATAKMTPQIGLIPYLKIYDSDILRFNNRLYWAASLMPVLPPTVTPENRWYAEHFVYTHVPQGFLMLDAHNGTIIDNTIFFKNRRIYYGEGTGSLFDTTWAAFPTNRINSTELEGYSYTGKGGITLYPPLSWMFEPNFLLSYPLDSIHVLRYREVHQRIELIYPYFEYRFGNRQLDILPVTNGQDTYWLIPLIARLDTQHVPWSKGNDMFVLVGYALLDTYNGTHKVIIIGNDFFSKMFEEEYKGYVTRDVPDWLSKQLRYPEELFIWKVNMYNIYHVTDIDKFITAREFYEIPQGLNAYYIYTQPPGFDKPEFLGLLSLELRGAAARNLAGYIVVRNDYPNTGELIFYKVPFDSQTKLIGPSAVLEALNKNPDFAKLQTLLRNPRIGDNILYRIGNQDVYFIPVYTAGTGGVVAELGTIAVVGAAFTGEYYVGLGNKVEEAFKQYLLSLTGILPRQNLTKESKLDSIINILKESELEIVKPSSISAPITFVESNLTFSDMSDLPNIKKAIDNLIQIAKTHGVKRILIWQEGDNLNIGIMIVIDNILELHKVVIKLS